MSIIDNYGDFELPEEKSTIEVVEDPVKTVMSCYELLHGLLKTELERLPGWYMISDKVLRFYEIAEKVFVGKEKLKLTYEQMDDLLMWMKTKQSTLKGIFLSALHNKTALDDLIIESQHVRDNFLYPDVGFKLKKEKLLLIGNDLRARDVCDLSEGGILINYGEIYSGSAHDFRSMTKGIFVNNGKIESFGDFGKSGMWINNGLIRDLGSVAFGGIYINNNNHTKNNRIISMYDIENGGTMGFDSRGGIHIDNTNAIHSRFSPGLKLGIFIDNRENTTERSFDNKVIGLSFEKELLPFKQKLDHLLEKISFLKGMNVSSYQLQARLVRNFDWKKFEQDVEDVANEIKEAYGK